MLAPGWTLVAAVADPADVTSLLTVYGPLGLFAALLVWYARSSYGRETARSDRLEAEVTRLNTLIIERVIPALTSATKAIEDATQLLGAMQREMSLLRERDLIDRRRDDRA